MKTPFYKKPWVIAIFVVLVIVANVRDKKSTKSNNLHAAESNTNPTTSYSIPEQEELFISIISKAQSDARSAKNDMVKGGIKARRNKSLCSNISSSKIDNWIGSVASIDSNSDGKGVLKIRLSDGLYFTTWNNELSDSLGSYGTLIDPSSELFMQASSLSRRDKVKFSGNLFYSQDDCFDEQSITLDGKLNEPEYTFKFTAIEKI